MEYEIKRNREHFEVYINGELYCTADSHKEAREEIERDFNL